MGIVNKLFTSFSGLYNNINILTFSGVNDVIVVKGTDGKLRCSEFQLRFGKLYFPNMSTQVVHLIVNGKIIDDISMYITSQGELFFEKQTSNDEDIKYDDLLGYIEKLEKIKQEEMDENIKIHFERLTICKKGSEKWKVMEKLAKDNVEYFRTKRALNFKERSFAVEHIFTIKDDFYTNNILKYSKFGAMVGSPEYFEWILRRYRNILLLMNGLFSKPPKSNLKKKEKCDETGCSQAEISFSLCADKKVDSSFHNTFNKFITKEILEEKNLVVRIEGCKKCNSLFYFSYALFTKLFFELRASVSNKSKKLIETLEAEHNKAVGWGFFRRKKIVRKEISYSLRLNSDELERLNLKYGQNTVIFKVGGVDKQLEGHIYLWDSTDKIIISDIDGTITKSDVWGHIYSLMGKDWTHGGIASLFTKIKKHGYKILYLTARPLQQSFATKHYLNSVNQDGYKLPDGPVLLSPDGLFAALYREIIIKRPEDFKIACLSDILKIFNGVNPYVAGFGNRITDVITYKTLEIPNTRIFTVNPKGELNGEFSNSLSKTYSSMNDFIDKIFPYILKDMTPFVNHQYSDLNWWN
ncbi:Nuclear elongation and deformation protein 1 [Nosema granulosis]|uniref:Nuclear elongation and deformation protein 1 n=1 Tax=Nosema granulosis TaxID=83296 RepID=A0A9P6H0L7_9MICR|nr:Nuclear elongation and deformation protein 1 [Nosema granulosis]